MATPKIYLLDTNVISNLMREPVGHLQKALQNRVTAPGGCEVATSVVVQYELLYGIARKGSAKLKVAYELQMRHLKVAPLDSSVGPHYTALRTALERTGKSLSANDLLIAAHAIALGATLVSADAAFGQVSGLALENWLAIA